MIACTSHRAGSNEKARRPGLVSVAVLIALIVIAIIGAGLLKVALARRAEVGREERRLQASWLAGSGVERALSRLSASAEYAGETWEIPTEDLGGRGHATITIRVDREAGPPDRRKVHVQADYPSGSSLRSRESRDLIVPIQTSR